MTADAKKPSNSRCAMAEATLRQRMRELSDEFLSHERELADLRPEFWYRVGRLCGVALDATVTVGGLLSELRQAKPQLGAPGDFGYGTPCGDALRRLYDAWREMAAAISEQN